MIRLTSRDLKFGAAALAADAVLALAATVWALVNVLSGDPATGWGWIPFGVGVTAIAAAGALWCRRKAAEAQTGGAA